MKIKMIAAIALASAFSAAAFTACAAPAGQISELVSAQESTQAAASGTAASATESVTEPETTAAPVYHAEDYVVTERELEIKYSGKFLLTGEDYGGTAAPSRLPQLTIDSEDAAAINSEIHERHNDYFDRFNPEYPGGRCDYIACQNGKVLSLAIEFRSVDTPNSSFDIYNIDVETGTRISNEELFAVTDTSMDAVCDSIRSQINEKCDSAAGNVTNDKVAEQLERARQRSLADENIEKSQFFLNSEGKVCATYIFYWIAGAECYGELLETDGRFSG